MKHNEPDNGPLEGHAEDCHAVLPGDRGCNCHLAYGFDTAEDMEEADAMGIALAVDYYSKRTQP